MFVASDTTTIALLALSVSDTCTTLLVMIVDFRPGTIVWCRVLNKLWPALVKHVDDLGGHCVQLFGHEKYRVSEVTVTSADLFNYQFNMHYACAHEPAQRKLLHTACVIAQKSAQAEQRALFNSSEFKNFLSVLSTDVHDGQEHMPTLPQLRNNASDEIRTAYNHLRLIDESLCSKTRVAMEKKNLIIIGQLFKLATQCQLLAIQHEHNELNNISKKLDTEVAELSISRKAAMTYFQTLHKPSVNSQVQDLERAKNEVAHWKRKFEDAQKQLDEKKRRKLDDYNVKDSSLKVSNVVHLSGGDCNKFVTPVRPSRIQHTDNTQQQQHQQEPTESNKNLQMVAQLLTNMRKTVQSNIPSDQTSSVKRRSRSNSISPQLTTSFVSPPPKSNSITHSVGPIVADDERTESSATVEETLEEIDARCVTSGREKYIEAARYVGVKMVSKKYANSNAVPGDPARAFLADLDAFQEENGEKAPKAMKIDRGPLCSYRLMQTVIEYGGIRNVVYNGQMRNVMFKVGVKKVTNSTRIKMYYAQNLYRYERMLVHGVLISKEDCEKVKCMTWRKKDKTFAEIMGYNTITPVPQVTNATATCAVAQASASTTVAQASVSTIVDNTNVQVDDSSSMAK